MPGYLRTSFAYISLLCLIRPCLCLEIMNGDSSGVAARLARKNILELHPYRCARDDYSEGILLDANENAYGPALSSPNEHTLERYPDPYQIPLKKKLAAYRGHGLEPANIFVGVGSDEAIDLLMRIFCRPGVDKILTTPPTYGMYKVCAKVNDVQIVDVPLTPAFDVVVPEVSFGGRRLENALPFSFCVRLTVAAFLSDSPSHHSRDQAYLPLLSRKPHRQGHSS